MGNKSKKKTRKKLSSSSEEDEKALKKSDATKTYSHGKRKKDTNNKERCARKWEMVKDASQRTCQIRKLEETRTAGVGALTKEEKASKRQNISLPFHTGNCSSEEKNISGKVFDSGSKTVGSGSSKSYHNQNIRNVVVAGPQRVKEMSESILDEKSPQRRPSKLKRKLSPSRVTDEQKQNEQKILKIRKPSKHGRNRHATKTRDPIKIVSVKNMFLKEKGKEKELSAKRLCTTATSASSKDMISTSSTDVMKNVPDNVKPVSYKSTMSSSPQQPVFSVVSTLRPQFKIPKLFQFRPAESTGRKADALFTTRNLSHVTELSNSEASTSSSKETAHQAHSCWGETQSGSPDTGEKRSSGLVPDTSDTDTEPWCDEMQVVEELHLARSKKSLEVNLTDSYGELTCMDTDLPEDGAAILNCKQPSQHDPILVLDTNILLSHLDYVKRIRSRGLGGLGCPLVLIPWVVLQEMDSLKKGKGLSGSVAHLAIPAISYIYSTLKNREPGLWGQSMQQAAESSHCMQAENNDDRVLQCCLQYQNLYPECTLIMCTNDKNLCSKALLCGVKAFSKRDLESEIERSRHDINPLQNFKTPMMPHTSHQAPLPVLDNTPLKKRENTEKAKWDISSEVSELEQCLHEVLSDVLEVEMKAAYDDLWLEVVYLKPPWTLQDVLQCLKKHWIAVFGQIVQRKKLQIVLNLIGFFQSGKMVDCSATLGALQDARELVKAFGRSSSRVPGALSTMDSISNKLQLQGRSPGCDVVMNDNEEDSWTAPAQVPHQEVWALFEKIWSNVLEASMNVFKALGFDPHTMQSSPPLRAPSPPQEAVVFLYKLSSAISQLLQAFSSILSSAPGLEEIHTLLSVIDSNKIVQVDSRFTAKDLCDCFSQQEYREKLRVGGNQLLELKGALDRCVGTIGQQPA